uniref:Uncharacterized protein n=1 Tax=Myotis myotis TaxID=51298 RepID=A0A7J7V3S4_MYOMY|nr:hypothetical protein mMyoMyo1_008473 [Myotis myotis]
MATKLLWLRVSGSLLQLLKDPDKYTSLPPPGPAEDSGPSLGRSFVVHFQVVLPGQEFLLLGSLDLLRVEEVGVLGAVHQDLGPVPILGAPRAVPPGRFMAALWLQRGALAARVAHGGSLSG